MSPGRWIRPIAVLLGTAALVAAAAGPVRAAYQATADSNTTAFSFSCIGLNDAYPARMLSAALAGYRNLGYATTSYSGTSFSKAQVLSRTFNDWGFYVHSTGGPDSRTNRASARPPDSSADSSSDRHQRPSTGTGLANGGPPAPYRPPRSLRRTGRAQDHRGHFTTDAS